MTVAKTLFDKNIESILVLRNIYDYLEPTVHALDISELLRSEFVLCISALDHYIHHRVREGLLIAFSDPSKDLASVKISLPIVRLLLNETDDNEKRRILDAEIKNVLSKDSYQSPSSIENALGLICIKKLWSTISPAFGQPADDIKNELSLIINRRNKIAHEADLNFITGTKEIINKEIIDDTVIFIKKLVEEIDKI